MLTPEQQAVVAAAIKSAPTGSAIAAAYADKDSDTLRDLLAGPAVPSSTIWRSDVRQEELIAAAGVPALRGLSAIDQQVFMVLSTGPVDGRDEHLRVALAALFDGSPAVQAALVAALQRPATGAEALVGRALTADEIHDALWDGKCPDDPDQIKATADTLARLKGA